MIAIERWPKRTGGVLYDCWCELKDYADLTIKIVADIEMLRGRLIARKILSGANEAEAKDFVEKSDLYNARLCLNNSADADIELKLLDNGEYIING